MSCDCACHASSGTHRPACTIDTGSSGVEGITSCSPCGGVSLDDACILGHPQPVVREFGYACRRHYHWIDRTLLQIEELFALLDEAMLPALSNGIGNEPSATRTGSPAPGRVEVMALTDRRASEWEPGATDDVPDVLGSLYGWTAMVEESAENAVMRPSRRPTLTPVCPLRPDPTLTLTTAQRLTCTHQSCFAALPLDPPTLTEIIRFLRQWRGWIVQRPWLDDYVDDLAALHRHVARGVGDTMWPKPIGKCPNCGAPMYPTIGVDEAHCGRCKSTWKGTALARLRLIHEQEAS